MKLSQSFALAAGMVFLAACTSEAPVEEDATTSSVASSVVTVSSVRETKNVMYEGTVEPAGITIYNQGTHRLVLDAERFILLESDDVDLNGYVGEEVFVTGTIRPTVEVGGTIMVVERIQLKEGSSSSADSSAEESDSAMSSDESSAAESSVSSEESSDSSVASSLSSVATSEASSATSVASGSNGDKWPADFSEQVSQLAAEELSAENWTQEYCSTHIGFCVPIHRNWWYKSFGNTTSHLWHVEIATHEIETIGKGAIVIKLVSGSVGASRATDGQVRTEGEYTVGYRAVDDSRHFEIISSSQLEDIIEYMTSNLRFTE